MNATATTQALLAPGEGEVIEAGGNRLVIKVASPSQLVGEYTAPAHFQGPPLHIHPGFDETFLVLDGRIEVVIDEHAIERTAGGVAYASGNIPHTFRNPSDAQARFLLICTPGGFEHYFRAVAAGDAEAIAAISARFGYEPVESAA